MIKTAQGDIIQKVVDGKFVDPKDPEDKIAKVYDALVEEIEQSFASMLDG